MSSYLTNIEDSPFEFRSMTVRDEGYVYETWLYDLRQGDRSFLPNSLWFPAYRETIKRVLEHPLVQIVVLADRVDPEIIYGYIVRDPEYLHWVHVRRGQWRKRGLAKLLMSRVGALNLPLVWGTKLGHERLSNRVMTQRARRTWWSTDGGFMEPSTVSEALHTDSLPLVEADRR